MKRCPYCGADLSTMPVTKFCVRCGAPLPAEAPAHVPPQAQKTPPVYAPPQPRQPVYAPPQPQNIPSAKPQKEPKAPKQPKAPREPKARKQPKNFSEAEPVRKKNGRGGLIAAVIILAVFVAGFAVLGVLSFLEIHENRASISRFEEEMSGGEADAAAAASENEAYKAQISEYESQLSECEKDIDELNGQLDEKDEIISQLQDGLN